MDFLSDLEQMAANVAKSDVDLGAEPDIETIERWQKLFCFSVAEATQRIKAFRADFTRLTISDEHWKTIRKHQDKGFDREAYEYSLSHMQHNRKKQVTSPSSRNDAHYLLRLEGPLDTVEKVMELGRLAKPPSSLKATDDLGRPTLFCRVSWSTKQVILESLEVPTFQPTFVRISQARKDLSPTSLFPTSVGEICPKQEEYPVWYFFYGTLAQPEVLSQVLGLSEPPVIKAAEIRGGSIKVWGGKYKALVDGLPSSTVHGHAFEVDSREQEEALRIYETEKYEVVRCRINIQGEGMVRGLTFRFVDVDILDPDV
jgi:hypothetical protein